MSQPIFYYLYQVLKLTFSFTAATSILRAFINNAGLAPIPHIARTALITSVRAISTYAVPLFAAIYQTTVTNVGLTVHTSEASVTLTNIRVFSSHTASLVTARYSKTVIDDFTMVTHIAKVTLTGVIVLSVYACAIFTTHILTWTVVKELAGFSVEPFIAHHLISQRHVSQTVVSSEHD